MRLGGIDNRYAVLNRPSLHLCEIVDEGGHQLAVGLVEPQEITLHVVDEEHGAFRVRLPFCLVGRKACGDRHRIVGNAGDRHDDLGGLLRQGRLISGFGTLFLSVPLCLCRVSGADGGGCHKQVAQTFLVDLANGGERHGLDETDAIRQLVIGDAETGEMLADGRRLERGIA
ncbi:hypothetical protein D3C71_1630030 [compost metagenome]